MLAVQVVVDHQTAQLVFGIGSCRAGRRYVDAGGGGVQHRQRRGQLDALGLRVVVDLKTGNRGERHHFVVVARSGGPVDAQILQRGRVGPESFIAHFEAREFSGAYAVQCDVEKQLLRIMRRLYCLCRGHGNARQWILCD